jgi:hypothetical protein
MTNSKVKYDQIVATTTMFWLNKTIEEDYKNKIDIQTDELVANLTQVNSIEGLKRYIIGFPSSLENILCLLNISVEKFKRIVSLLRIKKQYTFQSEWDLRKTRNSMLEKEELMNEICQLLSNGFETKKYKDLIPQFYLESFKIDISVISRLSNIDDLKRLIKSKLETSYNNDIANSYFDYVASKLKQFSEKKGYDCEFRTIVSFLGREVSFCLKHKNDIKLIVDISYMVTTSSSQTDYAKKVKSTFDVQKVNEVNNKNTFQYIVIIDGAGWIGRQSDLQLIYKNCNHFLNIQQIDKFQEIVSSIK